MAKSNVKIEVSGANGANGSTKAAPKVKKTVCPVSRAVFRAKAPRGVEVAIAGKAHTADVKEFSTGSLGFYLNGKTTIDIDGKPVQFQIGLSLTAVGSKELPYDADDGDGDGDSV